MSRLQSDLGLRHSACCAALEIIAENPARTDAEIMAFMFEATQYRHSVVDLLDIVAEARRWYVEDNCTDNQINREAVQ